MPNIEKITEAREVNQLITQGKEKGYLTYEEINDVLPSDVVAPEQIDDLMHLFGENDIHIVDSRMKGEILASTKDHHQEQSQSKEENSLDGNPPVSKIENISIDDPVRMYLREMGTISLLTREGEVVIAKKIEEGQNEAISAVANCGITINEILTLGTQVKKGEISILDIIQSGEPEDKKEFMEKDIAKKFLKNLKNLKAQDQKLQKLRQRLKGGRLSEKMKAKLEKQEKTLQKQV
ncbi:MAG: RNA polymerase sigma factor region1.1 domain-containing protein, partial [Nitrospinota bacterium]|nr:RNA polymerase sigma factor region1.1 domain-containing protein [Nitrospinota bacterium]